MKKIQFLFLAATLVFASCKTSKYAELGDGVFANIQTSKGDIILKLEHEKTPVTVANFVSLAEGTNPFVSEEYKGKKYYDGIAFHRIIKDFMIQGGDPTGTGSGSPGYKFKDEFNDSLTHHKKGILSMANAGPLTNGSQFFITHKATPFLNNKHTVFGEVVTGIAIVDSIATTKTAAGDKPVVDVVMNHVEIIRNGKEAKRFNAAEIMTNYFETAKTEAADKIKKMAELKAGKIAEFTKQKEVAVSYPSGLKIYTITKGTGEKPKIGQKVDVFYAGYFEDANLFDSNDENVATAYQKFDHRRKDGGGYNAFPMDYSTEAQLAAGFREALLTMSVGDKIRAFLPSHLAYGEEGRGNVIPPNANLIFDLEITAISK